MNDMSNQTNLNSDEIVLTDEERQPCEVWTRVMGYHRPVASFNIGKKGEHYERKYFQECRTKLAA
jgi:anaerobic ribonucleoside-triphosphate reductase